MKKLKLIITFILLVSLFLGVVACTPNEESKAESSADVSEDVSVTVSDEVSEAVSNEESIDETLFYKFNATTNDDIIPIEKSKGDRDLYVVTLITSGNAIDTDYKSKYGLSFSEALDKYDNKSEGYKAISENVALLLPKYKEDMIKDIKSTIEIDNIILDDRLICDMSDSVVDELWFDSYKIGLLVYANEDELSTLRSKYDAVSIGTHPNGSFIGVLKDSNGEYQFCIAIVVEED
ncbi:MAG: hypothetical protein IJN75_06905 [Clostridia bacterium]|nr:hypothetical protein [Clostridia bacterium]